jgi:hypothetical protein
MFVWCEWNHTYFSANFTLGVGQMQSKAKLIYFGEYAHFRTVSRIFDKKAAFPAIREKPLA